MTETPVKETWVVLGGSSTVARAFARLVAARGDAVLLAGRDGEDLERTAADLAVRYGVTAAALDFDAEAGATHGALVEACRARAEGPLNVFLAFAVMTEQGAAEHDAELARRIMAVTYLGAASVLERFAPALAEQGRGRVVALGSVAGDRARRSNYLYGAAKAALHAYLDGLRLRLAASGVTVTTVKPGVLDTAMTWGLTGLPPAAAPEGCAHAALRAAESGRRVVYYPWPWRLVMLAIRAIPEPAFRRLRL